MTVRELIESYNGVDVKEIVLPCGKVYIKRMKYSDVLAANLETDRMKLVLDVVGKSLCEQSGVLCFSPDEYHIIAEKFTAPELNEIFDLAVKFNAPEQRIADEKKE